MRKRLSPSMAVALTALFVSLGGVGYAATGGNFILGVQNDASTTTALTAPVGTTAMRITNNSQTAGATALSLVAASGHPALKVNTPNKVVNLNADRLDGLDSAVFGRAFAESTTVAPGFNAPLGAAFGFMELFYSCSDPTSANGALILWNQSATDADVFIDSGGADPVYELMTPGESKTIPATAAGDSFQIVAQSTPGVLTIDVGTVHRSGGAVDECDAQAVGVLQN